jgi:hypothetical protein
MRAYLITSTEYKHNNPDRFIMDENGNYYGVGEHSYAISRNFPKSIDYWMTATCADSDRYFNIVSVELTMEQLEAFDNITKEYIANTATAPVFGEQYPDSTSKEWKSKKQYNAAAKDFIKRYEAWMTEHRDECKAYRERESRLANERKSLFDSFFPENGGVK